MATESLNSEQQPKIIRYIELLLVYVSRLTYVVAWSLIIAGLVFVVANLIVMDLDFGVSANEGNVLAIASIAVGLGCLCIDYGVKVAEKISMPKLFSFQFNYHISIFLYIVTFGVSASMCMAVSLYALKLYQNKVDHSASMEPVFVFSDRKDEKFHLISAFLFEEAKLRNKSIRVFLKDEKIEAEVFEKGVKLAPENKKRISGYLSWIYRTCKPSQESKIKIDVFGFANNKPFLMPAKQYEDKREERSDSNYLNEALANYRGSAVKNIMEEIISGSSILENIEIEHKAWENYAAMIAKREEIFTETYSMVGVNIDHKSSVVKISPESRCQNIHHNHILSMPN